MKLANYHVKESADAVFSYFSRIRYAMIAFAAYVFVLHFRLLNSLIPGIDTEHLISSSSSLYGSWDTIGRQGLMFLKKITGNYLFNPDFAVILTLALLVPTCLLVPFLGRMAAGHTEGYKGESWLALFFGMAVVSHPILTEQLYFTLQSAEVVMSFLLLELCIFMTHQWATQKGLLWPILTVLILQIPFSTYQAFVPLFIAAAVGMAFMRGLFSKESIQSQWIYILKFMGTFLVGFLLNQLISSLLSTGSTYLTEQINWTNAGFVGGLMGIFSHIRDALLGGGAFYFREFGVLCVVLLVLVLCHCLGTKAKKATVLWQLFLLAAWYGTPFYLSVLLGIRPVIRAQLVLPFTTAGTVFLIAFLFLQNGNWMKKRIFCLAGMVLILLGTETIYHEASITSRLYYSDAVRAQGDYTLAASLQEEIQKFTGETDYDGVVVFLGRREAASNPSCITGDIMGQSFFHWDTDVEPKYFYSSHRIINFMNCLGTSYSRPNQTQATEAAAYMDSLSCYPAEGCMMWVGDNLVVKLSEE